MLLYSNSYMHCNADQLATANVTCCNCQCNLLKFTLEHQGDTLIAFKHKLN